jgi:phosphatidylserine/phosphatidylglycerophosphate/cardiolipin synthase-like enzyme
MDGNPALEVKLFLNIQRPFGSQTPEPDLVRDFAKRFRTDVWPGTRLPEVYYDPRALEASQGPRACLHAKCLVVDDRKVLLTSANFTEAAQVRNIEAGVVVEDAALARQMRGQFEELVEAGGLRPLPVTA